jgi:two-component system CheB/CheR fusion protein
VSNDNLPAASASFPIVGIGASAGGLTALEQFLSHVPPQCGLAIVVVQHRDPHSEGMLVELLQRHTPMPVEPDHVYVIPPGWDLSLMLGVLHLFEPTEARGLRQPIDFFFKSLADDRQHNSIGVILSGMGSDGTLGLRASRQVGGASFAQTPASSQFDSMPRSATDARWFKVRIMPYRTQDNRIDGLVMTFADISASKQLEVALRGAQTRLQALMMDPNAWEADHGVS